MSSYVFDIESDGLLQTVTKCWIICAYDLETLKLKYWLNGDLGWMKVFSEAELLVGHNIVGYDIPVLERLFNWKPSKQTKVNDTLILSQILDYKRFKSGRHNLEEWGNFLNHHKGEHNDWSQYSEDMLKYCKNDVELTVKVWDYLTEEASVAIEKQPQLATYIRAEHYVSRWCADAALKGWPFDIDRARELHETMLTEMMVAFDALNSKLGTKVVAVDKKLGIVEPKAPKWTMNGCYNSHTASWFGISPDTGQDEDRLVDGPYSRIEIEPLKLSSVQDVKIFLFRNGWVPIEYNYKMNEETKEMEQKSPKITEESLEFLGGDGKLYCDYLTTSSRYNNLTTWINNTDSNGRLHGECMTIGTPSMRSRHSIIVNVPSVDSVWGAEMRELFTVSKGWKFIGADSAGNQARGLAHYLGSEDYVKLLLEGDIHQYNADVLTEVLKGMKIDHIVPRGIAKRILYAFLFGASGAKLWGYVFGSQDKKKGNKLKNGFQKAVPGLGDLLEKLSNIFGKTSQYGDGYIFGIAGNKLYVDSFHKLLVYLLQAAEKATCSAALMLTMQQLEEEEIPYQPLIYMHDEIDFMVPTEYAERAAEIAVGSFKEGPKLFGVMIMDGGVKIGMNWKECH
jgi:DNA polymerase-1